GFEPGRELFSNLSFSVGPRDRICVVGKNGKGKTTLLRTLAGQLHSSSGEIKCNATAAVGFYAQTNAAALADEETVLEEIHRSDPAIDQQMARNIAGMMMFEGDDALKRVKVLSGGEKNRLMLAKIIATPVNLLLLDEPTNHLDMESCDALLEAIDDFDGAVVMVTHNEMLLHGLAQRLIVFQGGGASVFEGSYGRFLEDRGWDEEKLQEIAPAEAACGKKTDKKALRQMRAEFNRERAKALKPFEKRMADLEARIVSAETELERLYEEVASASRDGDGGAVSELSIRIHKRKREAETCFERLESVSAEYEEQKSAFDLRMKELDTRSGGGE
ncbi:MAG: ATP-binding cassette domain-containing protein, partial [Candidatus Krumholzibacteria bacterium]|nr:ATP-binding cassette domain-containing protein [Candidatus Krumholzibacteria bacterium]